MAGLTSHRVHHPRASRIVASMGGPRELKDTQPINIKYMYNESHDWSELLINAWSVLVWPLFILPWGWRDCQANHPMFLKDTACSYPGAHGFSRFGYPPQQPPWKSRTQCCAWQSWHGEDVVVCSHFKPLILFIKPEFKHSVLPSQITKYQKQRPIPNIVSSIVRYWRLDTPNYLPSHIV